MGGGSKMGLERVENDGNYFLSLKCLSQTLAFLSGDKASVCL
jgi:hypothetical protein